MNRITYKLRELGEYKNGANYPKGSYGAGDKIVNVKDLFRGRFVSFNDLVELKSGSLKNKNIYLVEHGDLLFTRSSLVKSGAGMVAMINKPQEEILFCGFIIRFRPNKSMVNPLFLLYLLRSPQYRKLFTDGAVQTNISNINQDTLGNIEVELPNLDEQSNIVNILNLLDSKIELNKRINAELESMAKTLYDFWFLNDDKTRKWKTGRLGDFIKVNERSVAKGYPYNEIEYIDISSVSLGHLESTTTYALKDSPSRAKRLVQHGDTIWSTVRPNRKSYLFISNPKENLVVSTGFAVLTPKNIPSSLLYFLTTTKQFVNFLVSNAEGSAYPAVSPERFIDAKFSIPPENYLKKFENITSPILAQIAHNETESQTLAELRDWLLPMLLNSQVAVEQSDTNLDN